MPTLARRDFLRLSMQAGAAAGLAHLAARPHALAAGPETPHIIDTNVHLLSWPHRQMKYDSPAKLADKLRGHRVRQAWAGSFEALLHKNLPAVNDRLSDACRREGDFFLPFGSVNPVWPGWRRELVRCAEELRMPGIRLYPSFHAYGLDEPAVAELFETAAGLGLVLQIAVLLEDPRVHHPVLSVAPADLKPLPDLLQQFPTTRVQLLNAGQLLRGPVAERLLNETQVAFDISHLEGNGGLGLLLQGKHWNLPLQVPVSRMLFGSHAPYFPTESATLKLFESPLELAPLQAIMSGNAERLLAADAAAGVADSPDPPAKDDPRYFALDPRDYGVPDRDALQSLRIWDLHYHGFLGTNDFEQHRRTLFYVDRFAIERVFAVDIAGQRTDPFEETGIEAEQRTMLEEQPGLIHGIIRIDPSDPVASIQKMERWIRNGPCIGIKYAGFNRDGLPCSHPNNDGIIRLAADLDAVIYIHTWLKVGGEPRRPGGGNNPGESTPMDVAELAARFPDVPLICGHSGGDWELGVQAIRNAPNVLFEFAGSDPHSGQVDLAVRLLGAERVIWGGHGPTRSYATELAKVLDADLDRQQRMLILGGNLRRLCEPIFLRKEYSLASAQNGR